MTYRSFLRKLLLFSLPFLFFVLVYFFLDPFKVFKHYDCYYTSGKPDYISLNKDVVSTETWIDHYPAYQYDSYIFGNSRSIYYEVNTWKDYIHADASHCYHFDASGESIYGISKKVSFLSSRGVSIKNALVIVDYAILNQVKNSEGHLFRKDPHVSGENAALFQVACLKDYFDFKFLYAYFDFKASGRIKDYMKQDFLLDDRPFFYDCVTNEMRQDFFEEMIKKDPEQYYGPRRGIFYLRDTALKIVAERMIHEEQTALLDSIYAVFHRDGTNYRIVINPLYDQKKLHPEDLKFLQDLFGEKNVFDFSGANAYTNDMHNFYETSHYRPQVARQIMKIIYADSLSTAPSP